MRPHVVIAIALLTGAAGFALGRAFDTSTTTPPSVAEGSDAAAKDPRERPSADDPRTEREHARSQDRAVDEARPIDDADPRVPSERAGDRAAPTPAGDTSDETDPVERARRERELVSTVESCQELLGKPIERPKEIAERFSGSAVSRAVGEGIKQAGVIGDVEGVDCSEFPCIVFARLAGDEEDIEEIERSAALDAYEGDVLTLLLWATTVAEDARAHATARETGLFALAYYDEDDRAELGEDLDRRIRARVLEVWNAERPGPADAVR
jgi:hypothetical protein